MKISNPNSINVKELSQLLINNGIQSTTQKPLFGKEFVEFKVQGVSFRLLDKGNEYLIDVRVPIGLIIFTLLGTLIVLSIIFTILAGDSVIIKGGFFVYFFVLWISSVIYKNSKKEVIEGIIQKLSNLITEKGSPN